MDIQNTISQLLSIGLTQTQIGREIGRSQATVCDMASGKSGCLRPSADVVSNLRRLVKRNKEKLKEKPM